MFIARESSRCQKKSDLKHCDVSWSALYCPELKVLADFNKLIDQKGCQDWIPSTVLTDSRLSSENLFASVKSKKVLALEVISQSR